MLEPYLRLVVVLAAFVVVALASKQVGALFARFRLPLISGFIFTGILAGPFFLGLIPEGATEQLRLLDQTSLAVIAFAVGGKLHVPDLRDRMRSIAWVSTANALLIPLFGAVTVLLLADRIPFLNGMSLPGQIAIALVIGTVLATRAPAVAIAIINEMRARGPFTQTILGVTMVTDVAVIILFAVVTPIAGVVLDNLPLNPAFLAMLFGKLVLTVVVGLIAGLALRLVLQRRFSSVVKTALMLAVGLSMFVFGYALRDLTHANLPYAVMIEPLLSCLIASFYITNYTEYRSDLLKILADVTPVIYLIFFTLVGAGLALDVLVSIWPVALALFAARIAGIFVSSFAGGVIAGDPMRFNRVSWMTFLTQAGVGLGLAKGVAAEYPGWGDSAAAMIVSAIVLSELVGPPLFKWAISYVGEAHTPAPTPEYEGPRTAVIFGLEGQSVALARMLVREGWSVRIGSQHDGEDARLGDLPVDVQPIGMLSESRLRSLGAQSADTIVAMLDDDENYAVCELAYERFGTKHLIVRLNDRQNRARFEALGAIVLDPSTAIVSLLAHLVRAPSATSLLLGERAGHDLADIQMCNPAMDGLTLRDIRLPLDVLVLSVERDGNLLLSHGYTRLKMGDVVTLLGAPGSLQHVALQFSP